MGVKKRVQQELAVTRRAGDGRLDHLDRVSVEILHKVPDFLDGLSSRHIVTHDAAFTDVLPADFELRLHQNHRLPPAPLVAIACVHRILHGRDDECSRDETHVHADEIDGFGDVLGREIACICFLQKPDARVTAEAEVELAVPGIDGDNARGAVLQQAIGEAARGGSDIHAHLAGHVDAPVGESGFELQSAAADVFQVSAQNPQLGLAFDCSSRLLHLLLVGQDLTGENQCLSAFPRWREPAIDQQLVDSHLHADSVAIPATVDACGYNERPLEESIATAKQAAPQAESEYPIGANTLRRLYTYMLKCRAVEEHVRTTDPRWRIRGREAIVVAATIGLRHDDHVADSKHALFIDIARGKPLNSLPEKIRPGKRRTSARGGTNEFRGTAATQFSIATGVALDFKMHKKHSVVIALALGGAEPPDFWHEPASYAALHKLPIVFVVQARATKARNTTKESDLSAQAEKFGLPGIPVDDSDAVAVYRVAHEAIDRARRGAGPALIECRRWIDTSAADPIRHMQQYLDWKGLWSEEWGRQTGEAIRRELESAMRSKRSR